MKYAVFVVFLASVLFAPQNKADAQEAEQRRILKQKLENGYTASFNDIGKNASTAVFREFTLNKVRERLKDPYSAKFHDVRVHSNDGFSFLCGYVNAKNAFGGYTGRKPFIAAGGSIAFIEDLPLYAKEAARDGCIGNKLGPDPVNVRQVQQYLKDLGYYNGDLDGLVGPETKAAAKKFRDEWLLDGGDTINKSLEEQLSLAMQQQG